MAEQALKKAAGTAVRAHNDLAMKLPGVASSVSSKSILTSLGKFQTELEKVRSAVQAVEGGPEQLAVYDALIAKAQIDATREELVEGDAAAKKVRDDVYKSWYWFRAAVRDPKRIDVGKAQKYLAEMTTKFDAGKAGIAGTPAGDAVNAFLSRALSELGVSVAGWVLAAEADKHLRALSSKKRWLDGAIKNGDANKTARYWEEFQKAAEPIISNTRFHTVPEVQTFLATYQELQASMGGNVADMEAKKFVADAGRTIKSKAGWLSRALDKKNINEITKQKEGLVVLLQPLMEKYSDHEDAKPILAETQALLDRVDAEVGPMLLEQEATALVSQAKSVCDWLDRALANRDEAKASEYREKLEPLADQLRAGYSTLPIAQDFLQRADATLARIETDLGAIIAEKDITRIANQANTATRWLEKALDNKDSRMAQEYSPKIEELVSQLRRYESVENGATLLSTLTKLLGRVDSELGEIIALEEVTAAAAAIASPLRFLCQALDKKDVQRVVQLQDRVVELALPLRKYASVPAAVATLAQVDSALGRIKGEVEGIIARHSLDRVEKSLRAQLELAKNAATGAAAPYLNKALYSLHPLFVQYGGHPFVSSIYDEAVALVTSSGATLSEFQVTQFGKIEAQVTPLLKRIAIEAASSPAGAIRLLADVNKLVLPVRKAMLVYPGARALLEKVDGHNLALVSRIPLDEEYLPVLDINLKAPRALQDSLKKLNPAVTLVNQKVGAGKKLFEALALDGSNVAWVSHARGTGFADTFDLIDQQWHEARTTLRNITDKLLPNCTAACGDWTEPGLDRVQEAVATLLPQFDEWTAFMQPRTRYAQKMAWGTMLIRSVTAITTSVKSHPVEKLDTENLRRDNLNHPGLRSMRNLPAGIDVGSSFDAPRGNLVAIDLLDKAAEYLNAACTLLPDEHAEATHALKVINDLKAAIELQHVEMCVAQVTAWTLKWESNPYEWEQKAKYWAGHLSAFPTGKSRAAEVQAIIANVEKMRADKVEKEREERERVAKEKETQRLATVAALVEKYVTNQTDGGSVQTPDGHQWDMRSDGTFYCSAGDKFSGIEGKIGESRGSASLFACLNSTLDPAARSAQFPPLSLTMGPGRDGKDHLWFSLRGFRIENTASCHSLLTLNMDDSGLFPGPNNAFVYERLVITGQVPVHAACMFGALAYLIPKIKEIVTAEHEKLRRVIWKTKHLADLRPKWNRACSGCNTSGANWKFCTSCEGVYCTNSFKCGFSGGSNICPMCRSSNGRSTPSFISDLKDPPRNVYMKAKLDRNEHLGPWLKYVGTFKQ